MGTIVYPNILQNGSANDATEVMADFNAITAQVNGNIDADNIKDGSITAAKISGQLNMSSINSGVCAFSAYLNSDQAITSGYTKVTMDTEDFDITGVYDNATNYRFTPTTAGKYNVSAVVAGDNNSASPGELRVVLYKNGSAYCTSGNSSGTGNDQSDGSLSIIVDMNGSADYLEVYSWSNGNNTLTGNSAGDGRACYWSANLVFTT